MGQVSDLQTSIGKLPQSATLESILTLPEFVKVSESLAPEIVIRLNAYIQDHSDSKIGNVREYLVSALKAPKRERLRLLQRIETDSNLPVFLAICFLSCPS